MNCPKCKKDKLDRKRTLAEGNQVKRENVCRNPKCRFRMWTVERPIDEVNAELARHSAQLREQINKTEMAEYELNQLKSHLTAIARIITPAKKKVS